MTIFRTLTGDLQRILGDVPRSAMAFIDYNVTAPDALVDLDNNKVYPPGPDRVPLNADGTFSIQVIDSSGAGTNIETPGTLRCTFTAQYVDAAGNKRTWVCRNFEVTGDMDLADAVASSDPPASIVRELLQQAEELVGVDTTDAAFAYNVNYGPLTGAALTAEMEQQIAAEVPPMIAVEQSNREMADADLQIQIDGLTVSGTLTVSGAWDVGSAYSARTLVTHSASVWLSSASTTAGQEPGVHASWVEIPTTADARLTVTTSVTGAGDDALASNAGASNTAFGSKALRDNVSGTSNTAVGANALILNTGAGNTAVGAEALEANVSGTNNVAVGLQAQESNQTGAGNVAVGPLALRLNTTGGSNTAVGNSALRDNTAASNVAMGSSALLSNTTGTPNTGIGTSALTANTTGGSNTALGYRALMSVTTASSNTAVGVNALRDNTGSSNTAVGVSALLSNTTGNSNTAVGVSAAYAPGGVTANATTTAIRQTVVGYEAGQASSTPNDSITTIGYRAVANANAAVALGAATQALHASSVALGSSSVTTAANQVMVGNRSVFSTRSGVVATAGANAVTNGTFTGGADGWALDGGATYGTDNVNIVPGATISQDITVTAGLLYQVAWTDTMASGDITVTLGAASATARADLVSSQLALLATATGTATLTLEFSGTGTVDSVTVTPLTKTQPSQIEGHEIRGGAVNSIGMGIEALRFNTTGTCNTGFGHHVLTQVTNGVNNVAIGHQPLQYVTSGRDNVAVGHRALNVTSTAINNSAVGTDALRYLTTASSSVGVGYAAGRDITTGNSNTIVGANAAYAPGGVGGRGTTTGTQQTSIGTESGQASATQRAQTAALGYRALYDADGAVALGALSQALHTDSVALGRSSVTTAASQVMVGARDIEITDTTKGLILKSPDGTRYRVTVANGGALSATAA